MLTSTRWRATWVMVREAFEMAGRTFRADHARAALTTSGVLVAVATIIVTVGLSDGLRQSIYDRLGQLSAQIEVTSLSASAGPGAGRAQSLTDSDVAALRGSSPGIADVTPVASASTVIRGDGGRYDTGLVAGTTADYLGVANRTLTEGRFFSPSEQVRGARVVVLGPALAEALFGPAEGPVLGRSVLVGRLPFQVAGVLEQNGHDDDVALMPLDAARDVVAAGAGTVTTIIVTATGPEAVSEAAARVDAVLYARHHVHHPLDKDYRVTAQGELVNSIVRFDDNLELFVMLMTAVLLVLGGIGIGNIMMVTVTQRTGEIGLRRAVGARRDAITTQFLLEAAALAGLGGLCGAVVGVVVTLGAAVALPLAVPNFGTPTVSWAAVVLGLAVSVLTGVAAGVYPARRASRLPPIEALRHE